MTTLDIIVLGFGLGVMAVVGIALIAMGVVAYQRMQQSNNTNSD